MSIWHLSSMLCTSYNVTTFSIALGGGGRVGSPNTVLWSNDTLNFNLFWQPEVQLPELLMQFVIFFFALS